MAWHARRETGAPAVRKLPSGRWQARVLVDGKHLALGSYGQKADANAALRDPLGAQDAGTWVDPRGGRVAFGTYADEWIAGRHDLAMRTRQDYKDLLRLHLKPAFAATPLAEISIMSVRRWWARASGPDGHGRAPKTAGEGTVIRRVDGVFGNHRRRSRIGAVAGTVRIGYTVNKGGITMSTVVEPDRRDENLPIHIGALPPPADPAPLGLAAFALTTFLLSAKNATWTHGTDAWLGYAFAYGGLCQLLAGMWEFRNRNVFGSTAFSTYGGFWIGLGLYVELVAPLAKGNTAKIDNDLAWILLAFLIFNSYMLLWSLWVNPAVFAVFLTLEATELLLVIGNFSNNANVVKIGGIVGVITAAAAWYASAAGVINGMMGRQFVPVGKPLSVPRGREAMARPPAV